LSETLIWILIVEFIGIIAFPISFIIFRSMPDRGITLSIPLGIVIASYATWILSYTNLIPANTIGPLVAIIILAIPSIYIGWINRNQIVHHLRKHLWLIAVTQVIFLALFLLWTLYRAYDPAISHTEQPMDLAFLNAVMRTEFAPPEDPWLRGEAISYYYFGYWIVGFVANLIGTTSNIAYNLSLSLIPAITSVGVIGLVYNIIKSDGGKIKGAILSGLIGTVFLLALSNLEGFFEFIRFNGLGDKAFWDWLAIDGITGPAINVADSWRPTEFWWWWRATRVINTFDGGVGLDYTIQEFPLFSSLLGDLHPHFLSLPFVILFLGLLANFILNPVTTLPSIRTVTNSSITKVITVFTKIFIKAPGLIFIGFVLGALGFINAWDLPIFGLAFLGALIFKIHKEKELSVADALMKTVPVLIVVIGSAFLFFSPYYLYFESQFSGITPVLDITSRPIHFFIVWGLFLVVVIPFVLYIFAGSKLRLRWFRNVLISFFLAILPFIIWLILIAWFGSPDISILKRFVKLIPNILVIFMSIYSALYLLRDGRLGGNKTIGLAITMLFIGVGFTLIMTPELIVVSDQFGSRMNTVFKLYYQAWILLSISAAISVYYLYHSFTKIKGVRKFGLLFFGGLCGILIIGSLYYGPAASFSKIDTSKPPTLDGLLYIKSQNPDEFEAIELLTLVVQEGEALVEAVGPSYSEHGRISAATGIPTILGWPAHEKQWRGSDAGLSIRTDDVQAIYQSLDPVATYNLLAKYKISYVYIGPRERRQYGTSGLNKFDLFMDKVFNTQTVVIYKLR